MWHETVDLLYHRTLSRHILQRFLGKAKECWRQFDEYDSRGLHCVKQTSEQKKVRRSSEIQFKIPHRRSPYAMKFEDRSPGKTVRQERCARGDAWDLANKIHKLKKEDKATFYSFSEEWIMPAASICGRFRSKYAHGQQERP